MRRAGAKHLAILRLLLSRLQFYGRWSGQSVLACVEEATEESECLLGLEPTWEALKVQCLVAVDALPVSSPPTSSAQVAALDLDQMVTKIKEDAHEHSNIIERLIQEANIQISSLKT